MLKNKTTLLAFLAATALAQQGSLTDARDNQTYKTVKIGTQTWMAQNLNYNAKESVCYDNKPENCQKYGRLYNWNAAMKACPKGWHLPSNDEWEILMKAVGGEDTAGKHLKAKSGWNYDDGESGNGLDSYGFSALPCGYRFIDGSFDDVGNRSYWWSANERSSDNAYGRYIYYSYDSSYRNNRDKANGYSVRCIKDN
jgi:uncharacterized protein (TIGR02145 family)